MKTGALWVLIHYRTLLILLAVTTAWSGEVTVPFKDDLNTTGFTVSTTTQATKEQESTTNWLTKVVPISAISLILLGLVMVVASLGARLCEGCHSRAAINDADSDISECTRDILKKQIGQIFSDKQSQEKCKEKQLQATSKAVNVFKGKLQRNLSGRSTQLTTVVEELPSRRSSLSATSWSTAESHLPTPRDKTTNNDKPTLAQPTENKAGVTEKQFLETAPKGKTDSKKTNADSGIMVVLPCTSKGSLATHTAVPGHSSKCDEFTEVELSKDDEFTAVEFSLPSATTPNPTVPQFPTQPSFNHEQDIERKSSTGEFSIDSFQDVAERLDSIEKGIKSEKSETSTTSASKQTKAAVSQMQKYVRPVTRANTRQSMLSEDSTDEPKGTGMSKIRPVSGKSTGAILSTVGPRMQQRPVTGRRPAAVSSPITAGQRRHQAKPSAGLSSKPTVF